MVFRFLFLGFFCLLLNGVNVVGSCVSVNDFDLTSYKKEKIIDSIKLALVSCVRDTASLYSRIDSLPTEHVMLMDSCQKVYGIPSGYYYRLIYKESSFVGVAESPTGAFGYMQMTNIAYIEHWGEDFNKTDILLNIRAGSKMLSDLKCKIDSSCSDMSEKDKWRIVFASYNAGYSRAFVCLRDSMNVRIYVNKIVGV